MENTFHNEALQLGDCTWICQENIFLQHVLGHGDLESVGLHKNKDVNT